MIILELSQCVKIKILKNNQKFIDSDKKQLYDFYKKTDEVEIKIDRALTESLDGGNKQNAAY